MAWPSDLIWPYAPWGLHQLLKKKKRHAFTSQRALYVQCTYIVRTVGTMYVQCTYIVRTVPAGIMAIRRAILGAPQDRCISRVSVIRHSVG